MAGIIRNRGLSVKRSCSIEAIFIDEGESKGKKAKLSRRISRLIGGTDEEKKKISSQVVTLYGTRSDCVHEGLVDVEKDVMFSAIRIVGRSLESLFGTTPVNTMATLSEVVEHLEGPNPGADRERWISEKAYLRYRDVIDNPGEDRSLQHWGDAEREYNGQRMTATEEPRSAD